MKQAPAVTRNLPVHVAPGGPSVSTWVQEPSLSGCDERRLSASIFQTLPPGLSVHTSVFCSTVLEQRAHAEEFEAGPLYDGWTPVARSRPPLQLLALEGAFGKTATGSLHCES
jgi:hypothetical protein